MSPVSVGFSRPADQSFEAYKAWLLAILAKLGGEDDMTEDQWQTAWREFWASVPEAPA